MYTLVQYKTDFWLHKKSHEVTRKWQQQNEEETTEKGNPSVYLYSVCDWIRF